jgi:hypothetical protein
LRRSVKNTLGGVDTALKQFLLLLLMLGSLTFLSLTCKDIGQVMPNISITLKADDISCTEVLLRLHMGTNITNRVVTLKRDTITLFAKKIDFEETLFTDTNLLPGHTYSYQAQLNSGFNAHILVRTLDTTNHAVQWYIDTLGAQGFIRDVWVFSRTNAIAVGEIYLNDSTGKPDLAKPYNAAQWDGVRWELKKIQSILCGSSSYITSPLYTIFAFASNDIWYSDGGEIIHWNGNSYSNDCSMNAMLKGAIIKIWGMSNNNLYAVGNSGTIIRYNGSSWTKMESGTTVDLKDVYGLDANHVWATGTNSGDGHCVIMQYNGSNWNILYDNNIPPIKYFNTVWTDRTSYIYVAGGDSTRKLYLYGNTFGDGQHTGQAYSASRIRGTGINDIFMVGGDGECSHFNGNSWHLYPELKSYSGGTVGLAALHPTNDFIVLGGGKYVNLNEIPIVIRGYR